MSEFTMESNPTIFGETHILRMQGFVIELLKEVYEPMSYEDWAKIQTYACSQVREEAKHTDCPWQRVCQEAFISCVKLFAFNHSSLPTKTILRD